MTTQIKTIFYTDKESEKACFVKYTVNYIQDDSVHLFKDTIQTGYHKNLAMTQIELALVKGNLWNPVMKQ